MFGGALLVIASYVVALGFSLTAFHAHASWLDVTTVYLGGSAVASAAPTPGKVGAVEAALIAGLTGVGIASGPGGRGRARVPAGDVLAADHSRLPCVP